MFGDFDGILVFTSTELLLISQNGPIVKADGKAFFVEVLQEGRLEVEDRELEGESIGHNNLCNLLTLLS